MNMRPAYITSKVLWRVGSHRTSSFVGRGVSSRLHLISIIRSNSLYNRRCISRSIPVSSTSTADPIRLASSPPISLSSEETTPLVRPIPPSTELRTHTCGHLALPDVGQRVRLLGWAHAVRDRGGVLFVLLRDRHGIIQITIGDQSPPEAVEKAKEIRLEYVVDIEGVVAERDSAAINSEMATGAIEVIADAVRIVSRTKPMPFIVAEQGKDGKDRKSSGKAKAKKEDASDPNTGAGENTRLKYRYLDLRRPALQEKLLMRHKATMATRSFLDASGFVEIETPILTKATPEGARDYLVPSRVHPGSWYALPQSPQIYKQLLMVSGFDRYFQITKCFRDEDLRQDRQPEFTQIDLEMSFVERSDVMSAAEGIIGAMFARVLNKTIDQIPKLNYEESMSRFGVDAPDMRFGMELKDITAEAIIQNSGFAPIATARENNGLVKALVFEGAAKASSRKVIDGYTAFVKTLGLSGLLYGKIGDSGAVSGPLSKLSDDSEQLSALLSSVLDAKAGDLVLVACGKPSAVNSGLGKLRVKLGQESGLIKAGPSHAFCWVVDFPLFEYDQEESRFASVHHPFTSPLKDQMHLLDDPNKLGEIKSDAYDLVCNGSEIGGGSIRIHNPEIQQKVFAVLGISEEEQKDKFGFLIDALSYGAPPHGGLAFGLDRCIMILSGADSIRDVVAFPKTTSASDLMARAPAPVPQIQLEELSVRSDVQVTQEE